MSYLFLSLVLSIVALGAVHPSPAWAQRRILVLGWNVESGDNDPATIAQQLAAFEGYDVIGLTEVTRAHAADYADAAGMGEGAKGNSQADFRHVVSQSGASDRMVIIWDNKRFALVGQPQELETLNDGNHRAPLVARFTLKNTTIEFLFMVNHLARGNTALRRQQATGLKNWAATQQLPIIAVGDYNFDYSIDDGKGNQAMQNMLTDDVWSWIRPQRLFKTQASRRFHSVLDFLFVAHMPPTWQIDSQILVEGFPSTDDNRRSDHRPLEGRMLIGD